MQHQEQIETVLKGISESDRDAFRELFYLFYTPLFRHADNIVKNNIISEEIVSEVFFSIWKNRLLLSEVQNIDAYLHTAVKNRSISFLRQVAVHRTEALSADVIAASVVENDGPELAVLHKELQSVLQAAIENLPARCRAVFKMARISGMPYKKIAELLGISVRTVDAQLVIAQQKLQLALHPYMEE